jgi:hypothetical protein
MSGLLACGSRTGLFDDEGPGGISIDVDGGVEIDVDGSIIVDGGVIVPDDAPSTIDARPVPPDVFRADCPDSDALLVYVISSDYRLQSFNPDNGQFRTIGNIACPAPPGETPFSMAVDRKGTAYILFTDENIYRVSTATGACIGTSYVPRQSNFARFGMGFATNDIFGPSEKLYVAGDPDNVGTGQPAGAGGLASIDPTTFALTFIGYDQRLQSAELTGTGDGRLFAFYRDDDDDSTSNIGEVDTQSGQILGERHFESVDQGSGWAFAFWGGDFYMFHAPGASTTVTRWRPVDNSVATVATAPSGAIIVGAGVSTCAPQQ